MLNFKVTPIRGYNSLKERDLSPNSLSEQQSVELAQNPVPPSISHMGTGQFSTSRHVLSSLHSSAVQQTPSVTQVPSLSLPGKGGRLGGVLSLELKRQWRFSQRRLKVGFLYSI
jgi:hypothetical protein